MRCLLLFCIAASIYFEKVIKTAGTKLTIWDRNFQLAFHSILLFVGMVAYETITTGKEPGGGWTWLSVAVAVLGALGGILVALSVI
jgi:UDP-sugar transporter A1/2/3